MRTRWSFHTMRLLRHLRGCVCVTVVPALSVLGVTAAGQTAYVRVKPDTVPVLRDADVLVYGGTTGAVAAAAAAARAGARVVLLTPFPYLGEDMTATYRLECRPDEYPDTSLARRIFHPPGRALPDLDRRLPFTYKSNIPSSPPHPDTSPPSVLNDLRWGSARTESVQYNGDPTVTLDLGQPQPIETVHVLAYHANDFLTARVEVRLSLDAENWSTVGEAVNNAPPQKTVDEPALDLTVEVAPPRRARYVQVVAYRGPESGRILLGEIVVAAPKGTRIKVDEAVLRTTPVHVKAVLTEALLRNGVDFYLSCYPLAVLHDCDGKTGGLLLISRAGPFAVRARSIIDGTFHGWIARLAGATVRRFDGGPVEFERTVIGGAPPRTSGIRVQRVDPPLRGRPRRTEHGLVNSYPVYRCRLSLPLKRVDAASLQNVEQTARDRTWTDDQERASDVLFCIPPQPILCRKRLDRLPDFTASGDLDAFRPRNLDALWVLSGAADLAPEAAAALLRPCTFVRSGIAIGRAAANSARTRRLRLPLSAWTPQQTAAGSPANVRSEVRLVSDPLRFRNVRERLHVSVLCIPAGAPRDVVVAGGGTGGAPAGIGAARSGAKTLVLEMQYGLGGVGTLGAITKYYWGYRKGFTAEVEGGKASWRAAQRREWWRRTLRKAGGDAWFGVLACGVMAEGTRVRGVVAASASGPLLIPAKVVVDATGSADLAFAAGAPCQNSDLGDFAVQGTGLPPVYLGADYVNTDWTIADETDLYDVRRLQTAAAFMSRTSAFDIGPLVDSRERRRILGEAVLSPLDQILERVFPDTISQAWSNFDSHGYSVHPVFYLCAPDKRRGLRSWIPYRCLLPRGVDGLLVTALGLSAHRDALPGVRMQPDIQNVGYAAGVAAALAAGRGGHTRQIPIRELQKRMIRVGILPADILDKAEKTTPSDKLLRRAVADGCSTLDEAAAVLARPDRARPLLRESLKAAHEPEKRLRLALVLAFLHDPTGVDEIIAALDAIPDFGRSPGWDYRSAGQFGWSIGPADQLIIALGDAGDRRATPAIARKAAQLQPQNAFSHFRAVALAFDRLRDRSAVPVLRRLLMLKGVRGHALTCQADMDRFLQQGLSFGAVAPRRNAARELLLARALWHCGDADGLARQILETYSRDWRAHFARHATAVLGEPAR